ncbi:PAS domain S-box protein [Tunturiibacter lichenicola]|uniref:PAS domain S-box protein n=1 Tax=Tunturiibacter lichenicola TaxID=2051959 RepID=UPI0021B42E5E|nr:PAS domain S-box protein [Edaphobacter lichenicola]
MTSRFQSYFFATAMCVFATILSRISGAPSSCYHLSIVICSLYGGRRAGILSVVLSIVCFDYLFLPPHFHFAVEHSAYPRFAAFIGTAVCINLVIEAKQRGDRARREVEEQHRVICETALDGVLSIGHHDQVLLVNSSAAAIFGYPATEMIGQPITLFVTQFHAENKSTVVETTGTRRDGTEFIAEISTGKVASSSKCGGVVFVRDITERKGAENALRTSESYLAAAQRVSHTGSFGWNVSSGKIVWSAETFRIAGVDPNLQPTLQLIYERIHPEDRASVKEIMQASSKQGLDLDFEHRFVLPDGSVKFVRVLGKAVHDRLGRVEYIGAAMDVTASKTASESLQKMEKRLARASQIATLGEVSASIAHEINQPLTAIIANAHMCLDSLSSSQVDTASAQALAQEILDCSYQASDVVQRMRNLFKGGTFENIPLDINEVIKEVLNLIRSEAAKRRLVLEMDIQPELPAVLGDRIQIQQVMVNLCINGLDAMNSLIDRPRKLSVRTRVHGEALIRVEVQDSGVGLQDPDRIFEAFFTTKENGMGMGLPICRSIIELHKGSLWPQKDDGHGTTFCFTLPVSRRTVASSRTYAAVETLVSYGTDS